MNFRAVKGYCLEYLMWKAPNFDFIIIIIIILFSFSITIIVAGEKTHY